MSSCNYSVKYYVDWTLQYSQDWWGQRDLDVRQWVKFIWWDCYYTAQSNARYLRWYVSNFIVENGAWDADKISSYYESTKENYWK